MAVFTGASSRAAHLLLEETGLLDDFTVVVAGDEIVRQKPHPDGILQACEHLGVAAQAAAYVCDASIDLEAARRAGALAVGAGWGHQYQESKLAQVTLEQPDELLGLVCIT